jgi:hypothetical protein
VRPALVTEARLADILAALVEREPLFHRVELVET